MDNNTSLNHLPYVLITPARNEEAFIEKTIVSVINQTVLPVRWVIVDDASTDKTPEIISRYLPDHPWIEMVQMPPRRDRSFAAKVHSFNAGYEKVKGLEYEVIGNLDSDVSFGNDFLGFLIEKFAEDPSLGVAGTIFKEDGYSSEKDSFEGQTHVSGQVQLFRRRCFEEIGGYIPHRAGGIDWMAVTTARMMGWKTKSFREKFFFHYRHLGTAGRSVLAADIFLRRERLLSRRASHLGVLPRRLPSDKAALYHCGHGAGVGVLLGFSEPHAAAGFPRTDGLSPPGADDQAKGHFKVASEIQARG